MFSASIIFDYVSEITFFDNQNKALAVGSSGKVALFDISKRKKGVISILSEN